MFDRLAGAVCVRVQNQLGANSAHPALLMFKADTVVQHLQGMICLYHHPQTYFVVVGLPSSL